MLLLRPGVYWNDRTVLSTGPFWLARPYYQLAIFPVRARGCYLKMHKVNSICYLRQVQSRKWKTLAISLTLGSIENKYNFIENA